MKKSFFLRIKLLDISTGYPWIVVMHEKDARRFGVRAGDKLNLIWRKKRTVVTVDLTDTLIKEGQIGLFGEIRKHYEVKKNDIAELNFVTRPVSIQAIQKKLLGKRLSYREIKAIITDIVNYKLREAEIAFYIAGSFMEKGLNKKEIYYTTKAMAETGKIFNFGKKIVADKHSTGGLPGNRVTPIIVAIISSYGICIPKTSSRAVTSAAGTADTFEVLAPVTFNVQQIEKLIKKNNACLVWGAEKIAPADDMIIRASYQLGIEPYSKMVISIMSKKVAMGINHLILDIPVSRTAKISSLKKAKKIASLFRYLAKKFNIKIKIAIHRSKGPIGRGIGPSLEARDVLRVLQQKENRPQDLETKSIRLAGGLLELIGKAKKGSGFYIAKSALVNGSAWRSMQKIIKAQGGNEKIDSEEIVQARIRYKIRANKSGRIYSINNKNIANICHLLGAPEIKKAGLYLNKVLREPVKKGDVVITLYTVSKMRLDSALSSLKKVGLFKIK